MSIHDHVWSARRAFLLCLSFLLFALSLSAAQAQMNPDPGDLPAGKRTRQANYLYAVDAARMVAAEPRRVLFVDVRTSQELQTVGRPQGIDAHVPIAVQRADGALNETRKEPLLEFNRDFIRQMFAAIDAKGLSGDDTIILICRSGQRSAQAADLLQELGLPRVYSVADGFEGDMLGDGPHKGKRMVNGWKVSGLPWTLDPVQHVASASDQ